MSFLEKVYRSPFGRCLSIMGHFMAVFVNKPFMVYGFVDPKTKYFRKYTRMSSKSIIMNKKNLVLADHVWIGHYCILDATEGLVIGEGFQTGAWVGIFTHGSENAIRLLGKQFVHMPHSDRPGYSRGCIKIGAYTYIGSGSIVLPGVSIGKGCLVGAGTLVTEDIPDYAIVKGWPGKITGNTLEQDQKFFKDFDYSSTYFDTDALSKVKDLY